MWCEKRETGEVGGEGGIYAVGKRRRAGRRAMPDRGDAKPDHANTDKITTMITRNFFKYANTL